MITSGANKGVAAGDDGTVLEKMSETQGSVGVSEVTCVVDPAVPAVGVEPDTSRYERVSSVLQSEADECEGERELEED